MRQILASKARHQTNKSKNYNRIDQQSDVRRLTFIKTINAVFVDTVDCHDYRFFKKSALYNDDIVKKSQEDEMEDRSVGGVLNFL